MAILFFLQNYWKIYLARKKWLHFDRLRTIVQFGTSILWDRQNSSIVVPCLDTVLTAFWSAFRYRWTDVVTHARIFIVTLFNHYSIYWGLLIRQWGVAKLRPGWSNYHKSSPNCVPVKKGELRGNFQLRPVFRWKGESESHAHYPGHLIVSPEEHSPTVSLLNLDDPIASSSFSFTWDAPRWREQDHFLSIPGFLGRMDLLALYTPFATHK